MFLKLKPLLLAQWTPVTLFDPFDDAAVMKSVVTFTPHYDTV